MSNFEPRIVGVLCNWCSYSGADMAGSAKLAYPSNLNVVRVMCSGRVDATLVLQALAHGADGVLIAGCHPGDCHYVSGNCQAEARVSLLRRTLGEFGVEPERVRLEWVSAREGERFAKLVSGMTEEIRRLGPLGWPTILAAARAPASDPSTARREA
jgi:F420-non-reducing hydrogenase iron-sulfur subunit